jgi:hypothetical protein
MKQTDRSRAELAEAFHREGVVRFSSGLEMDVRMAIEWPKPFPQVSKMRIARDLCCFMDKMRESGFGFRPIGAVQPAERAAGEAFSREALTEFAIGAVEELAPSLQTDWTFGAILIGATQFLAKVEAGARLVIARAETSEVGSPPEVLDLLGEFLAVDREALEAEGRCLEALAQQANQPPSVQ